MNSSKYHGQSSFRRPASASLRKWLPALSGVVLLSLPPFAAQSATCNYGENFNF